MENSTGAKYLHKKFKKPTLTSVTITKRFDADEHQINNNRLNLDGTFSKVREVKPNDVLSSSNSSSTNSVNRNNDQVASISTRPFASSPTSPQSDQKTNDLYRDEDVDEEHRKFTHSAPNILVDKLEKLNEDKTCTNSFSSNPIVKSQDQSNNNNISSSEPSERSSSQINGIYHSHKWDSTTSSTAKPSVSTSSVFLSNSQNAELSESDDRKPGVVVSSNSPTPTTTSTTGSGGGKYVCSYCNLSCSKPSVLQKHIRAHTNERPYPCVSCGFSFKTRSNLYKHCRSRSHANRAKDSPETTTSTTTPNTAITTVATPTPATTTPPTISISPQQPNTTNPNHINNENLMPKNKPYKPKFKLLTQQNRDNEDKLEPKSQSSQPATVTSDLVKQNPDLLNQHITNLIHKNQTILDVNESNYIKRRLICQQQLLQNDSGNSNDENQPYKTKTLYESNLNVTNSQQLEEPLNLTARNRKRCMSETEHTRKSLIKELLLKNLSQDHSYVCQFCKISFKNIENFEIHRKNYCKVGENPTSKDIAFVRSHSVNVASVLTQKYSRNNESPTKFVRTTLPLKSPGPFLGKTSLVDSKIQPQQTAVITTNTTLPPAPNPLAMPNQVFYENRNPTKIHRPIEDKPTPKPSLNFALPSPNEKRGNPDDFHTYNSSILLKKQGQTPQVKLFGGEVKITNETSGETRSFKIDSSKNVNDFSAQHSSQYIYGNKVSENMVVKSGLQSGGTILQNTPTYDTKSDDGKPIFQYYDSTSLHVKPETRGVSQEHQPSSRFSFSDEPLLSTSSGLIYDQNIIDFNHKAAKMFAPNLKQPNLTIPGLPIPNKVFNNSPKNNFEPPLNWSTTPSVSTLSITTPSSIIKFSSQSQPKTSPPIKQTLQPDFDRNVITATPAVSQFRFLKPLHILVNGKLVPFIPGMPGPAEVSPSVVVPTMPPIGVVQANPNPSLLSPKIIKNDPPLFPEGINSKLLQKAPISPISNAYLVDQPVKLSESKIPESQRKLLKSFRIKQPNGSEERKLESLPATTVKEDTATSEPIVSGSKFLRPNSLAIKPFMTMKTHHGLTPTMFNQALISPDTPRVAKKNCQLYLNGNCFSYLGLKSSTKPTYCTLNKTQPFYVQSFGKLSMYSAWRHLECKLDYVRLDTYDSRQRRQNYSVAKMKTPDLIVDSSYKSVLIENMDKREEANSRSGLILKGGYESNEDYTYIRGRGRGRYVCDQCGIRCKKPSMLKKHIRTHSDVRPYTCRHCNFSFKTKGNLTKHMKSKAHYKRTTSGVPNSPGVNGDSQPSQCSTPSDDDSDTDMENENDSDDSTRLQDHEAAHCLLSLAQNRSPNQVTSNSADSPEHLDITNERLAITSSPDNTNHSEISDNPTPSIKSSSSTCSTTSSSSPVSNALDTMSSRKPLTYPYYKVQSKKTNPNNNPTNGNLNEIETKPNIVLYTDVSSIFNQVILGEKNIELNHLESCISTNSVIVSGSGNNVASCNGAGDVRTKIATTPTKIQFISDKLPNADVTIANFQQKFVKYEQQRAAIAAAAAAAENTNGLEPKRLAPELPDRRKMQDELILHSRLTSQNITTPTEPIIVTTASSVIRKVYDSSPIISYSTNPSKSPQSPIYKNRKRKLSYNVPEEHLIDLSSNKGIDLSTRDYVENHRITPIPSASPPPVIRIEPTSPREPSALDLSSVTRQRADNLLLKVRANEDKDNDKDLKTCIKRKLLNYHHQFDDASKEKKPSLELNLSNSQEADRSTLQTLADVAVKRVTLENTKLAQSVATEYLKLATKNETGTIVAAATAAVGAAPPGVVSNNPAPIIIEPVSCNGAPSAGGNSEVSGGGISDLIVKSEENKSCTICSKNFSKPSQLRLHMNIHYIERPFRCESCSVSFRSKGHLQKHERSASHHNKLSSSPTTSSSEPRPFKCSDCNIAFRIHGHLAKHLRSKMHIMRLECLARVPFGLYAELERANSLLTEINTTDCDMCLDSLKILARKLFSNDPSKLVQIDNPTSINNLSTSTNPQQQENQQITVGSP